MSVYSRFGVFWTDSGDFGQGAQKWPWGYRLRKPVCQGADRAAIVGNTAFGPLTKGWDSGSILAILALHKPILQEHAFGRNELFLAES